MGDAQIERDADNIKVAVAWDGWHGVVTHLKGMSVTELFHQYRQLWQMEDSFRVTTHDLRAAPDLSLNRTPDRAHLAMSLMAYACVRHLAERAAVKNSPCHPTSSTPH